MVPTPSLNLRKAVIVPFSQKLDGLKEYHGEYSWTLALLRWIDIVQVRFSKVPTSTWMIKNGRQSIARSNGPGRRCKKR